MNGKKGRRDVDAGKPDRSPGYSKIIVVLRGRPTSQLVLLPHQRARRRACPWGLEGLGYRRLKHGGCQHPSEAWWRRYRRFLLLSRAVKGRNSGGGSPARNSSVAFGGASGTSATCAGFRRNPWLTSCLKAGETRAFRAGEQGTSGQWIAANTRRRNNKLQQSPVRIGETGESSTL